MARILYTDLKSTLPQMKKVLASHFDVQATSSAEEATALLQQGVDMVICGLQFEDSDIVSFLEACKKDPATAHIPVVCIRATEGITHSAAHAAVDPAVRSFGAVGFFDLVGCRERNGVELSNQRFIRTLQRILADQPIRVESPEVCKPGVLSTH